MLIRIRFVRCGSILKKEHVTPFTNLTVRPAKNRSKKSTNWVFPNLAQIWSKTPITSSIEFFVDKYFFDFGDRYANLSSYSAVSPIILILDWCIRLRNRSESTTRLHIDSKDCPLIRATWTLRTCLPGTSCKKIYCF